MYKAQTLKILFLFLHFDIFFMVDFMNVCGEQKQCERKQLFITRMRKAPNLIAHGTTKLLKVCFSKLKLRLMQQSTQSMKSKNKCSQQCCLFHSTQGPGVSRLGSTAYISVQEQRCGRTPAM